MNDTTDNLASILRRVEKLLAIAGDDRANPEEAAAAAGMAERIMRKYQIDHADIILSSLKRGDDMEEVRCVAKGRVASTDCRITRVPAWAQWMAVRIAQLNETNLRISSTPEGEACVNFQGFGADAKLAGYTFNYLVAATNRLCAAFRSSPQFLVMGRAAANSYRNGVALGICSSLEAAIKAKLAETAAASVSGRSLVVVKAQAVAERFGELKTKKGSVTTRVASAFSSGVAAGREVNVNTRGIGSSGSPSLRIAA